jgi:hypothetical protein
MGNPESDGIFSISGGTEVIPNLEVGASANYMDGVDKTTTTTSWKWKGYHLTKSVTTEREERDEWAYSTYLKWLIPMDGITPYIGAQVPVGNGSWDIGNDITPIGGVRIPISDSVFLSAEYQQETVFGEERKWMFGGGIKF